MKLKTTIMMQCFLIILVFRASGQQMPKDNIPNALNAAGGYRELNNELYDFNIGEMVLVETFSVQQYLLSQGFLQPYFTLTSVVPTTPTPVDNNVITPNGDGKNDVLYISGLEKFPENRLRIFDRAGRLLYSVYSYKNDWNGIYQGTQLNEDTYYYVLDLGPGYASFKGFVSVIHDKF